MAWLQEIPKDSGKFYVYWYNPESGVKEYLCRANDMQYQELAFESMFREKMDGSASNTELADFMFVSMKSKTENLEKGTGKDIRVLDGRTKNTIQMKFGRRKFTVAIGGDVFFRRDKITDNLLPVANAAKSVDGRTNKVFITFGKQFFELTKGDQLEVVGELKRSLAAHPDRKLEIGDVGERFDVEFGEEARMFQSGAYSRMT